MLQMVMAYVEGHEKVDVWCNGTELGLVIEDLMRVSHA